KINNGMRTTEIADCFSVTPGAVTSMCDKLVKLELIQRIRENNDRRVIKMALTNNGDQKVQEIFLKFSQDKLAEMAN
ncbi:MarR family transcriptional regulator, partial [Bacillus paralicheniformis]|uniref:MarR family transcriptional regulator n=1 Tax=Bacillus paralicheniformis TaxID=1648923 RepID=UPI0020BE590C